MANETFLRSAKFLIHVFIPLSQIRKFLICASPQIANPHILCVIRKSKIRKFLQDTAQLKKVLKVVFLHDFLQIIIVALYAIFIIRRGIYLRICGGFTKPQIAKRLGP